MDRKTKLVLGAIALGLCVAAAEAAPPPGATVGGAVGGPGDVMFTLPLPPPDGFGGQIFFGGAPGPGPMLPLFLHRADLTPEQHAKVRQVLEADRQNLQKLLTRLEQANDRLSGKLFSAKDLKLADVQSEVDEVSELRRQLMVQGLEDDARDPRRDDAEQLGKVAAVKGRMDKLQAEMRGLIEGKE